MESLDAKTKSQLRDAHHGRIMNRSRAHPSVEGSGPSRIVIADDHPLFREALRHMLRGRTDLEVVAEAADGQEATELCRRFKPDLVLMDLRMPEMSGLEATRLIKRELPSTVVLMLTAHEDSRSLSEALKAGAGGYVLKYASKQEVIDAIQKVLSGESPIDQRLATQLLMRLYNQEPNEEEPAGHAATVAAGRPLEEEEQERSFLPETLTPRELEVLRLVARGQTNEQIAENLFISTSTVKNHMHHIIAKLGVSDRLQAAALAIKHGLMSL